MNLRRLVRGLDGQAGVVLGALAVAGLLALAISATGSKYQAAPPLPTGPQRWRLIPVGPTVPLRRGSRYRGCLNLSWANPVRLLSAGTLREKIEAAGFRDVSILEGDAPAGWDKSADCTRYIEATWDRDDKDEKRPSQIEVAWVAE
jgi:hypothetical protein